jgi:glycerol kinase
MDGDTVAGIVGAALLAVVAGLIWTSRNSRKNSRKRKVEKAPDARIAKLREQMERWRDEGYDVSELEDLFR